MPLFLTLRDEDGKALVTAMLPPGGQRIGRSAASSSGPATPIPTANTPMRSRPWPNISASPLDRAIATRIAGITTQEVSAMAITLEQFAAECRDALKSQPGTAGPRESARPGEAGAGRSASSSRPTSREGTPERQVLYEDPELGFTILAHGYIGAEEQQAARSRSLLGDLRPGRRRNDHDRLGLPRAPDRRQPRQGEARSATT